MLYYHSVCSLSRRRVEFRTTPCHGIPATLSLSFLILLYVLVLILLVLVSLVLLVLVLLALVMMQGHMQWLGRGKKSALN